MLAAGVESEIDGSVVEVGKPPELLKDPVPDAKETLPVEELALLAAEEEDVLPPTLCTPDAGGTKGTTPDEPTSALITCGSNCGRAFTPGTIETRSKNTSLKKVESGTRLQESVPVSGRPRRPQPRRAAMLETRHPRTQYACVGC